MSTPVPSEIVQLEEFLKSMGFVRHSVSTGPGFGDQLIELFRGRFRARIVRDRGEWSIQFNDSVAASSEWYDVALLRDALGRSGPDVLSLDEQFAFLKQDWHELMLLFAEEKAVNTHEQLDSLRQDRAKRMFPEWFR